MSTVTQLYRQRQTDWRTDRHRYVALKPVHTGDYIVADFGDNLQIAENSDCRRKRRLSQKSASQKSAAVTDKCDCRRMQRLSPLPRRFRRQSHFSATVWTGLYCALRMRRRFHHVILWSLLILLWWWPIAMSNWQHDTYQVDLIRQWE